MVDDSGLPADTYRAIARQLRCIAFRQVPFDICRKDQLLALAKGFDRFADRLEHTDDQRAA